MFASSFLATRGEPAAQQLGQDQHVELALVVEQEDRRPGGQVLGALDVEPDAGQRAAQLAGEGDAEVDGRRAGSR